MRECDKILLTWGTGTNTLGVVTLLEKTMDTTNWELEPSFCRARYGLPVESPPAAALPVFDLPLTFPDIVWWWWGGGVWNMGAGVEKTVATPRRYGWLVEDDGEQYGASCCHGRHCKQVREFQRQGIWGRGEVMVVDFDVSMCLWWKWGWWPWLWRGDCPECKKTTPCRVCMQRGGCVW